MRALGVVALFAMMALAGCADADEAPVQSGEAPESVGTAALQTGRGAISGVLVDDRFRPIKLTGDEPARSEFEAAGFLLVQETGDELLTNDNGEFQLLDVDPGTYTIRPSVDGHEGIPVRVDVRIGQYSETNLVVRRVVSLGADTIVSMDQTVMRTCSFQFADGRYTPGKVCFGDLSEDGQGGYADYDFTEFADQIYGVVMEYQFSVEGDWEMWISPPENLVSDMYERINFWDTDYGRHTLIAWENGTSKWAGLPFDPTHFYVWPNKAELGHQETYESAPAPFDNLGMGLGFTFQYTARMVVHAFLGENPEFETYAILA